MEKLSNKFFTLNFFTLKFSYLCHNFSETTMEEIELEVANLDYPQRHGEAFNLILKQKNGSRFIPVVIGVYEAKTIIMEVNKIKVKRPLVHDVLLELCHQLHSEIQKILIYGFQSGIYYVKIMMMYNGELISLDSRVSDAVVLALKSNIPIFINQDVFMQASYEAKEEEDEEMESDLLFDEEDEEGEDVFEVHELNTEYILSRLENNDIGNLLEQLTVEELKNLIKAALDAEAYEAAAKLDEELNRRPDYGK